MLVYTFLRTFAAENFVRNASLRKTKDDKRLKVKG